LAVAGPRAAVAEVLGRLNDRAERVLGIEAHAREPTFGAGFAESLALAKLGPKRSE